MNRNTIAVIVVLVLAVLGIWYWSATRVEAPTDNGNATTTPPAAKDDLIEVSTPLPNTAVRSPVTVEGRARGNWYFEASFPVRILDANGTEIGVRPAQAQGEWMTTDYVSFSLLLPFTTPTTSTGTLVLEKDNPSGLPENANELRVPIRFAEVATTTGQTRNIKLYYYDAQKDQGPGGAQCSRNGLVAVERTIPLTQTPLRDAIVELLKGNLTSAQRAQGLSTEFPLPGVTLRNVVVNNGVATLTFNDPQNRTGGGSCRVGILWFQIEATAKQFSNVTSARFLPEELFQP